MISYLTKWIIGEVIDESSLKTIYIRFAVFLFVFPTAFGFVGFLLSKLIMALTKPTP